MENKQRTDLFLPVSIIVAAVVIGGSILFASLYRGGGLLGGGQAGNTGAGDTAVAAAAGGAAAPAAPAVDAMKLGSRDVILGNANAPVTLVEYGDYQCPFCGVEFFAKTEPQIVQNYVNTGKVRFVFRDFPFLGTESTAAANAAQCANDQGKLWAYHDSLYSAKVADDNNGGSENDGFFSTAELLKLGQQSGIGNMTSFTSCVQNQSDAKIVAQREKTDGTAAGVNSTPMFFINGTQILGAQPYAQFQSTIDAALKS